MLLQTNSYIVPKERRAEHARLLRRFRQTLGRLGCDHFEVYEQVGANWSGSAESTGRYVQIMRFHDRKHQRSVQDAEKTDPAAQQLIAEFCDLINFPYQQQQGLFAVGFYQSVLSPLPMRRAAADEAAAGAEEEAGTIDPAVAAAMGAGLTGGMVGGLSAEPVDLDAAVEDETAEGETESTESWTGSEGEVTAEESQGTAEEGELVEDGSEPVESAEALGLGDEEAIEVAEGELIEETVVEGDVEHSTEPTDRVAEAEEAASDDQGVELGFNEPTDAEIALEAPNPPPEPLEEETAHHEVGLGAVLNLDPETLPDETGGELAMDELTAEDIVPPESRALAPVYPAPIEGSPAEAPEAAGGLDLDLDFATEDETPLEFANEGEMPAGDGFAAPEELGFAPIGIEEPAPAATNAPDENAAEVAEDLGAVPDPAVAAETGDFDFDVGTDDVIVPADERGAHAAADALDDFVLPEAPAMEPATTPEEPAPVELSIPELREPAALAEATPAAPGDELWEGLLGDDADDAAATDPSEPVAAGVEETAPTNGSGDAEPESPIPGTAAISTSSEMAAEDAAADADDAWNTLPTELSAEEGDLEIVFESMPDGLAGFDDPTEEWPESGEDAGAEVAASTSNAAHPPALQGLDWLEEGDDASETDEAHEAIGQTTPGTGKNGDVFDEDEIEAALNEALHDVDPLSLDNAVDGLPSEGRSDRFKP